MNHIDIIGKVSEKAVLSILKTKTTEKPMIVFKMIDLGLPYQSIPAEEYEVHFYKEAAPHICDYLKKDKEIVVFGHLKKNSKQEVYINAEYIQFTGKPVKEVLDV